MIPSDSSLLLTSTNSLLGLCELRFGRALAMPGEILVTVGCIELAFGLVLWGLCILVRLRCNQLISVTVIVVLYLNYVCCFYLFSVNGYFSYLFLVFNLHS
jgi:hypothetical protein